MNAETVDNEALRVILECYKIREGESSYQQLLELAQTNPSTLNDTLSEFMTREKDFLRQELTVDALDKLIKDYD